jgi:hypothetical protein
LLFTWVYGLLLGLSFGLFFAWLFIWIRAATGGETKAK